MSAQIPNEQKIDINSIPDKSRVIITGVVTRSYIKNKIDGEDLAKSNKNSHFPEKPHYELRLRNAQIAQHPGNELAEAYIGRKMFTIDKAPENGLMYTAKSKSNNPPQVLLRNPANPSLAKQILTLDGELAYGLKVTIVMSFYKPKTAGYSAGCGLDTIVVDEPEIKYAQPGLNTYIPEETLNLLGIQLEAPTAEELEAAKKAMAENQTADAPSAAAPAAAPVQQPAFAVPQQPVQQPAYAAPQPQAAPVQQPVYTAPQPQAAPAVSTAPAGYGQPVQPIPAQDMPFSLPQNNAQTAASAPAQPAYAVPQQPVLPQAPNVGVMTPPPAEQPIPVPAPAVQPGIGIQ